MVAVLPLDALLITNHEYCLEQVKMAWSNLSDYAGKCGEGSSIYSGHRLTTFRPDRLRGVAYNGNTTVYISTARKMATINIETDMTNLLTTSIRVFYQIYYDSEERAVFTVFNQGFGKLDPENGQSVEYYYRAGDSVGDFSVSKSSEAMGLARLEKSVWIMAEFLNHRLVLKIAFEQPLNNSNIKQTTKIEDRRVRNAKDATQIHSPSVGENP